MNRSIYTIFAVVLVATTACKDDSSQIEGFDSSATTIEAVASGGDYTLTIRSDREWTAVSSEPWIMVSPANGRGEVKCVISIDSTLRNDERRGDIRFSASGEVLQQVDITQAGFAEAINASTEEVRIASSASRDDRWFETQISSNVEFDVEAEYEGKDEWLSVEEYTLNLNRGARPRTTQLRVNWKMNPEAAERTAILHLRGKEGSSAETSIVVRQSAAPLIEDNRQGDSLAILTICERLECWSDLSAFSVEPMHNWEAVRLWEATDSALPTPEAVGRVRDLDLTLFNTYEGIPQEIKYLKYLETLSLFGNVNAMLKSIDMGEEVCGLKYLKALRVAAFGISTLPKNFVNLGATLEVLDLNSNNLTVIPEVLTPENFPHLKSINLTSNRRTQINNLKSLDNSGEGMGLHANSQQDNALRRLLLWESLEELSLSYNYLEGSLPDFKVGEDGVRAYNAEDVAHKGDTLRWAVENNLPRILPNAKRVAINLNFLTGELPEWLLYHPNLMEWEAEMLVYTQQEDGVDSKGRSVGFDNVPTSREYYFERYPLYRGKYEFKVEFEE